MTDLTSADLRNAAVLTEDHCNEPEAEHQQDAAKLRAAADLMDQGWMFRPPPQPGTGPAPRRGVLQAVQPTEPGMYVEHSQNGYAVWVLDEDGDWHEMPQRGEVNGDDNVAYFPVITDVPPPPQPGTVTVNADDLRMMLNGTNGVPISIAAGERLRAVRRSLAAALAGPTVTDLKADDLQEETSDRYE